VKNRYFVIVHLVESRKSAPICLTYRTKQGASIVATKWK